MRRFWDKVDKSGDCWLWTAGCFSNGYGQFRFKGKMWGAHRASWVLHNGPIPEGLHVCHKCDVKNCVNTEHLFLGTRADNMRDMVEKGRIKVARGEAHCRSKLTEKDVLEIRDLYATGNVFQKELGVRFGISRQMISFIVRRVSWTHV